MVQGLITSGKFLAPLPEQWKLNLLNETGWEKGVKTKKVGIKKMSTTVKKNLNPKKRIKTNLNPMEKPNLTNLELLHEIQKRLKTEQIGF